jgi:hypothetical protein
MVRIASQKTHHRIFVVGEGLLEGEVPDRLALYLPDGTPVDLNIDSAKMEWRGAWDALTTYSNESVVTSDSILWVAIQDVPVGIAPGSDATMWEEMVAASSGGGSGLPPGGTYGYYLTKASSVDGDAQWVAPLLGLPPGGNGGDILKKVTSADGHVTWAYPSTAVPNELPPTGATGDILAKGSDEAGDVIWIPPPSGGSSLPAGGTTSQVLAKNSATDGDVGWVAPTPRDMPVGGASGALLAKTSGADRDTGWITPPHDLPVGGASGYILAKASATDRDVGWVAVPHDLPVGGASGYILAKASAADRDVGWIPAPSGGGGSTTPARRTAAKTTGSLAAATDTGDPTTRLAGGGESGVWTLGIGVLLMKITVDRASRIRLYTTAAKRDADISRTRFIDPTGDHGCVSEFLLISILSMDNIPADYVFSGAGDTSIYYRIENYSLSAGSVTATVTVKDVEF